MVISATIQPLRWESDFFARPLAQLTAINETMSPPLTTQQLDHHAFIQAKIAATDYQNLAALQRFAFQLVEGEIDLIVTCSAKALMPDGVVTADQSDLNAVMQLAKNSFTLSRFRPPWFSKEEQASFYQTWAQKAVLATFDDVCLILKAPDSTAIQGFITLKQLDQHNVRIGLLAVDRHHQRARVGERLLNAAQAWAKMNKARYLRVATQTSNIAALNLYIKCGARIVSSSHWLYRFNNKVTV